VRSGERPAGLVHHQWLLPGGLHITGTGGTGEMETLEALEMAIAEIHSQLLWRGPSGRTLAHVVLPREVAEILAKRCEESLQRQKK